MQTLRRALILTHRYLGIPLSVLFVLWFVTGIAMIYVGGMPTLSAQSRLERLPALDVAAVRFTPVEAAERAASGFGRAVLTTVLDRPAYRFASPYGSATVFADTGEALDEIDVDTARGVAAKFVDAPPSSVELIRIVERPDQWTLQAGRDMPLYKFAVADGAGTEVYVSPRMRRSSARHDDEGSHARVDRDDSALVLHHAAAHESAALVLDRRRDVGARVPARAARPRARRHAVQQVEAVSLVERRSLPRLDALALHLRRFLRHLRADVGVQRPACRWSRSTGRTTSRASISAATRMTGGPVELEQFPAFDAAAWAALLGGRTLKELEFRRIVDAPYYLARYTGTAAEARPAPRAAAPAVPDHGQRRAAAHARRRAHADRARRAVRDGDAGRSACAPRHPMPTSSRTSCSRTTIPITTRATARPRCPCCA